MSYYYRIYGLNIKSDIRCDELMTLTEGYQAIIDVEVKLGTVSQEIMQKSQEGLLSDFMDQDIWFQVPKLAIYWIRNGREIIIQTQGNVDLDQVKLFVLGSSLGMIMLQRNQLAIHGGTVVLDNKGLLITGERGAGKSTLTSALREKGYLLVADDVSALDVSNSLIHPAYPQQKVCEDIMDNLGYDKTHYKSLRMDSKIKYLIPTRHQFKSDSVPLKAIVELVCEDEASSLHVQELKGSEKLMTIYRNIYRIEMKIRLGVTPNFFKQCIELSQNTPVYRISRPNNIWSVDEQIRWIEKNLLHEEKLEA